MTPATNKKCDDWAKKADSYEVIDQSSDCLQMYRDISKNLPDYTEVQSDCQWSMTMLILYRGLFLPCVIFALCKLLPFYT